MDCDDILHLFVVTNLSLPAAAVPEGEDSWVDARMPLF